MEALNELYGRLLHVGFLVLRQALDSKDFEWVGVEVDFLHNIPSLLNEPNVKRHQYFWFGERVYYIERVTASSREDLQSRMRVYYEPVWKEMEPLLLEWFEK